ncbi:MAG TPA: 5-formyltetrahydrofolate cyclo-ligase [Casimicrobiaceae bacterium]|nr:5-formyltetrahydrofolate cyclo-ligase [Casimicrobiaceae bacterium]
MASGNLRDAKRALRARVLAQRDRLAPDARDAGSRSIAAALARRDDFHRARTILLTLPFGSEWDTRPLAMEALAQGKAVALPRINLEHRMLDACLVLDLALDVAPGYRLIPEPGAHCEAIDPAEIDWALVPGVAFDSAGRRLGYGGGYYDRLLPLLRTDAQRIAGAFDLQIVERVPAAPHDLPVRAVITPTRILTPP